MTTPEHAGFVGDRQEPDPIVFLTVGKLIEALKQFSPNALVTFHGYMDCEYGVVDFCEDTKNETVDIIGQPLDERLR